MKKFFALSFVLLGIVFLAGCAEQIKQSANTNTNTNTNQTAAQAQDVVPTEPPESLSYSTTGINVALAKTTAVFNLTAEQLKDDADECGSQHSDGYYDELVLKFSDTEVTHYNFTYFDDSQKSDTYKVTLIPNMPGYTSLADFKKDFDICYAGGDSYPIMLNNDWLVFENSCGSGLDDGSGKPIGCQVVKDVVEPTLKLNSNAALNSVTGEFIYYTSEAPNYIAKSALGKVCFTPAQLSTVNNGAIFCFTNKDEALAGLNIPTDESCSRNYWGTGTIEIQNLTNNVSVGSKADACVADGSCLFNEAEFVKVVNISHEAECTK
jgi:hypothetical protein